MKSVLSDIKLNSVLEIQGQNYTVLGKGFYVSNDSDSYYKIFMSGHNVLIFSAYDDNEIGLGHIVPDLPYSVPFPEKIEFNSKTFTLDCTGHQVTSEVFFGETEGDCDFWDYKSGDETVSVAILSNGGMRADVHSKIIPIQDVKIINLEK